MGKFAHTAANPPSPRAESSDGPNSDAFMSSSSSSSISVCFSPGPPLRKELKIFDFLFFCSVILRCRRTSLLQRCGSLALDLRHLRQVAREAAKIFKTRQLKYPRKNVDETTTSRLQSTRQTVQCWKMASARCLGWTLRQCQLKSTGFLLLVVPHTCPCLRLLCPAFSYCACSSFAPPTESCSCTTPALQKQCCVKSFQSH